MLLFSLLEGQLKWIALSQIKKKWISNAQNLLYEREIFSLYLSDCLAQRERGREIFEALDKNANIIRLSNK